MNVIRQAQTQRENDNDSMAGTEKPNVTGSTGKIGRVECVDQKVGPGVPYDAACTVPVFCACLYL